MLVKLESSTWYNQPLEYAFYPIKEEERCKIQRLAVTLSNIPGSAITKLPYYYTCKEESRGVITQALLDPNVCKFTGLKELNLVAEPMINPYSKGIIRLFDIGYSRDVAGASMNSPYSQEAISYCDMNGCDLDARCSVCSDFDARGPR
jgi:hypothetical protein